MATKRIQVSLDQDIYDEINDLAKYSHTSSSKVASSLIEASLELQEDKIFSEAADKRLKSTNKWVNHEDAWK